VKTLRKKRRWVVVWSALLLIGLVSVALSESAAIRDAVTGPTFMTPRELVRTVTRDPSRQRLVDVRFPVVADSGYVWRETDAGGDVTVKAHYQLALAGDRLLLVRTRALTSALRYRGLTQRLSSSLGSLLDRDFAAKPDVRAAILPAVLEASSDHRRVIVGQLVAGLVAGLALLAVMVHYTPSILTLRGIPGLTTMRSDPATLLRALHEADAEAKNKAVHCGALHFTLNYIVDSRRHVVPAAEVESIRGRTRRSLRLLPSPLFIDVRTRNGRRYSSTVSRLAWNATETLARLYPEVDVDVRSVSFFPPDSAVNVPAP
jgi:hypothetical protein